MNSTDSQWLNQVKWTSDGLVPAIAQDYESGKVLMMAWMNREALALTIEENRAIYYSRSRKKLWRKGEESGHVQRLKELRLDCDNDVVLMQVEQVGGIACHTGRHHCFYQKWQDGQWQVIEPVLKSSDNIYGSTKMNDAILKALDEVIEQRKAKGADASYVASLLAEGLEKIQKKVGEEAIETILAAQKGDDKSLVSEVSDLWFHTLVLLSSRGLRSDDVLIELERRFGLSGLEEKASRHRT